MEKKRRNARKRTVYFYVAPVAAFETNEIFGQPRKMNRKMHTVQTYIALFYLNQVHTIRMIRVIGRRE